MLRKKRIHYRNTPIKISIKSWHNALLGLPAFIIGNSPSLNDVDLSCLENYFTVGINRAFYKIDPTVLMWQDAELWFSEKHKLSRLQSIKFCRDISDIQGRCYHFKLARGGFKLPDDPATLFGRGNTGALAFQFAYALGCNPIVLIGMDCSYKKGMTNFYGKNPSHKPHTLRSCKNGLKWIKKCDSGRETINCSDNNVFETKLTLEEAISKINFSEAYNRERFVRKLFSFAGKSVKINRFNR